MSEWNVNDDIDDEEGENAYKKPSGREGTVYLVDAALINDAEDFRQSLECIESDLLKSILANSRNLVSIIFYNTENSPHPNAQFLPSEDLTSMVPANCAVFIPLMQLSKDLIQFFKDFRESETFYDFKQKYGVSKRSSFCDALWLCSRLIIRSNYKLMGSIIYIFTNNEQPHMPGTTELQQTIVRAKDLVDNNITVELVPMVEEFNMEPFYKEFLCCVLELEPEQFRYKTPKEQQMALINRLFRRNYRRGCLRHMVWDMGNGLNISCDIFGFTRAANKPTAIHLMRNNNEIIVAKRCCVVEKLVPGTEHDDEPQFTEKRVKPDDLLKYQSIAGKDVIFRADEVANMRHLMDPGLRLLGFQSITELKKHWMVKQSYFLYPSESKIKGSTKLFRVLWKRCLDKQVYALCALVMQQKTSPRYVALLPQTIDQNGNDGFRIIHLPVESNISNLPLQEIPAPATTDEQVDLMVKMCKKFRFKYHPRYFGNPALQHFNGKLEALVYDETAPDIEDTTLPNAAEHDAKIESLLPLIQEMFGQDTGSKRGNDGEAGSSQAKSTKKDLSQNDIEQAIRNDRIAAVTVAHLKEFIKLKRGHVPINAVKKNLFDTAKALLD